MLEVLRSQPILGALGAILAVFLARFLAEGYNVRTNTHGKPGPPHSWLLGHLGAMASVAMTHPRRVHPHVYNTALKKKFNLGSFFYVDVWPMGPSMIVVCDPQIAQQVSVERNTLKHPSLRPFLVHLAGEEDMVSSNGQTWQIWRRMFNPGFSTQHLVTLVPGIVDDVLVYVQKFKEYASRNEVFRMEEDTTRLTVDVIGKVTLDLKFNMQRSDNPCIEAMRQQVHLLPNNGHQNPLGMYEPFGIYKRWRNDRIMSDYIGKVLDERFAEVESNVSKKQKKRTIIDLALDSYASGVEADLEKPPETPLPKMDKKFRQGAITQIRTFIFAGHDTTSSLICYVFYLLSKHPECLEKIRREHEEVLGAADNAPDTIKAEPHLLNKLEYTLCVIKEVLRLFPPASAPRMGEPDIKIRDPKTGEEYDTDGYMLWLAHYSLHHNEEVWGETVDKFDPDRFLPQNLSKIPEGAWRPFEYGYRNCIGQNLALLESRIILAMTLRQFDFTLALDSLDELSKDGSLWAADSALRQGIQNVEGEEMYQVLIGTAKPREGMPMRVRRSTWKRS